MLTECEAINRTRFIQLEGIYSLGNLDKARAKTILKVLTCPLTVYLGIPKFEPFSQNVILFAVLLTCDLL